MESAGLPTADEIELIDIAPVAPEAEEIVVEDLAELPETLGESIVPETEEIVAEEIGDFAVSLSEPVSAAGETLSIDEALQTLAAGETQKLEPYLWSLLQQFLPLLEYCNNKLDLGIGVATQVVRHKIENPDEE